MKKTNEEEVLDVAVNRLLSNPYQPRIEMAEQELMELSDSIKEQGLLQPIIIAKNGDILTIIAGHRRVAAHRLLDRKYIKAVVREKVMHAQLAIFPLVENLQRSDTNPIENAIAFKRILDEKIVNKQTELAGLLGISTAWLSKTLSILKLPNDLLTKVKDENYKDITVLAALNKVNKKKMLETFNTVKVLKRNEALSHIRSLVTDSKQVSLVYKRNDSKISINLTSVTLEKRKKVELLLKSIEELLR